MLVLGYSMWYTMMPVFALVFDEEVSEANCFLFPELYQDLLKGRAMSFKTFLLWLLLSVYQASTIMIAGILIYETSYLEISAITFTALIFVELLNIALIIHAWKALIIASELATFAMYLFSLLLLPGYFGQ